MSKRIFKYILEEVEKDLVPSRKSTRLAPTLKVAICLKFLAEGSYQQAVGKDFNLNVS